MRNSLKLVILGLFALLLASCSSLGNIMGGANVSSSDIVEPILVDGKYVALRGEVSTKAPIKLPQGAKLIVRLEEHGIMDVAAKVIAKKEMLITDQNFPISFDMQADYSLLKNTIVPAFSATIIHEGLILYVNDTSMPYRSVKVQKIEVVRANAQSEVPKP